MDATPLVSIVVPVYGEEPFLQNALRSITNQTYKNIEIIVVTEEITDETSDQLIANKNDIHVISVPDGTGLSESLNRGINASSGPLIARQDADDWSHPTRIRTQVDHLYQHPEIGLLGTASEQITSDGEVFATYEPPTDDIVLRWESLFSCPFTHSSVIFRRSLFERGCRYRSGEPYDAAEDYDLWMQIMAETQAANLIEPLIQYRVHDGSLSQQRTQQQISHFTTLASRTIRRRCPSITLSNHDIERIHTTVYRGKQHGVTNYEDRVELAMQYLDTLEAFVSDVYDSREVRRVATKRALHTMGPPKSVHPQSIITYIRLFRLFPPLPIEIIKHISS